MKTSLYGKYAGMLKYDTEYIENCSEMELFIQVSAYYEPVRRYNELLNLATYYEKMKRFYKANDDESSVKYFENLKNNLTKELTNSSMILERKDKEWEYAMDFCILQTAKFGTNVSYNPSGRVILTEEFNTWYQNWQFYVNNMDETVLNVYRKYRYEGKSLNNFQNIVEQRIKNGYEESIDIIGYIPPQKKKNIKQMSA